MLFNILRAISIVFVLFAGTVFTEGVFLLYGIHISATLALVISAIMCYPVLIYRN